VQYHIFTLVWGEAFVRDYLELALPFQLMPGNLPALSANNDVHYHLYTDEASAPALKNGLAAAHLPGTPHIHLIEDFQVNGVPLMTHVQSLAGPEVKYEIQRHCLLDLFDIALGAPEAAVVLLDSNFVISDGTLSAMAARLDEGYKAINFNVLKTASEEVRTVLQQDLKSMDVIDGRRLVQYVLDHPHHLQASSFVTAAAFTPYPSQICWSLPDKGLLAHGFIPHPLVLCATPSMKMFQSTADYDLVLKSWPDEQIYLADDSDEMMVMKHSGSAHQSERDTGAKPSARDLALFMVTCTHRRHWALGQKPLRYRATDEKIDWSNAERESQELIDAVGTEIETMLENTDKLDARFLMYLKSFTGPIEDYMSPAVEPAALSSLNK